MTTRVERLRALLEEAKLHGLLVGGPVDDVLNIHSQNRRYISGFTGSSGYALVTRDDAIFAADFRYTEQAEQEVTGHGFRVFKTDGAMKEWLPKLFGEAGLAGQPLGLSNADTTLGAWEGLRKIARGMPKGEAPKLKPGGALIEKLRAFKDEGEMATIQRAIDCGDAAFTAAAATLRKGMTENDVAREIEVAVRQNGGDNVSFSTIVAAGPWGARPHAHPRDERIGARDAIVIDMGARVEGYCSDLTRTVTMGKPSPKFRKIYEIVREAQQNAIENVEHGMKGTDAHQLAASVIERYGYGEQFGHGLGHGVGLEVHEAPYMGKTSTDTLENGMVFTIEPGIYLPGWGGIRIEDIVVMENGRARVLSRAPKLTFQGAQP